MGVVVTFNYVEWAQIYPEFSQTVNAVQGQYCFNQASLYNRNDGGGPVCDKFVQTLLMNMMTAHLAFLRYGSNQTGNQASPLVGRVASANEGSVSVQTDMQFPPGTPQWYMQTKYGAEWWAATAPYRTATGVIGPRRVFGPWPGYNWASVGTGFVRR